MPATKSSIDYTIDFTWKISSLYFNFTPVIFNILVNNLYDDILQLVLDPVIYKINSKYS